MSFNIGGGDRLQYIATGLEYKVSYLNSRSCGSKIRLYSLVLERRFSNALTSMVVPIVFLSFLK